MSTPSLRTLREALHRAALNAGFEVNFEDIHLEPARAVEYGHFACNLAMLLAGKLGKRPREVAEAIVSRIETPYVQKAEVAGPGFINLWIEQKFYSKNCRSLVDDLDDYLMQNAGFEHGKTMVIDYSHPNIAKPMGVHHLLSTIIGDSIKRIYRRAGWKVIADNFIGDMGTQFGKLMHAIREWGNKAQIEKDPIGELLKLYVKFHMEADRDVELDEAGRAEYKKFEAGDPDARRMWKKIVGWSLAEIQPIYDRLGISFDAMNGESFYEDKMHSVLEEGRKSGVFVDGDQGAWVIQPDDPEGTPVLIRKSDGTTLYITRDLARIKYWEKKWHPDLMVNVVDSAQEFHFKQLFFAARKLDLTKAPNVHVSFGRMQFKDGAMSTRKGNILLLTDLLDEAEKRAYQLAKEKAHDLSEAELRELARVMGIGAVKYSILSQARTTNIVFDWDKILTFEGNSAPYLMYTIARAKSVLRKSGMSFERIDNFDLDIQLDAESKILIHLMMYPDALRRAEKDFKPNHIANYLYQLAQDYNAFYNGNPILQADSESLKKSRLLMTASVIKVMEDGFKLLGMEVPERM
jgi:arginyl-tRNA synthetase